MSRLGLLGATALSLTLAVATPALAQQVHGNAGVRSGGMANAPRVSGTGGAAAFRGAQANTNFAGRGNQQFVGGRSGQQFAAGRTSPQFTQGQVAQGQFAQNRTGRFDRGEFRDRDGRFGRGAGFVTGLAVGSAFGYGAYADPYYYGDDYAYSDGYDAGYDTGYPVDTGVVVSSAGGDPSYCAQRYRSYDPATGTYLGFDGLRHPCL
ncbi:MAG TPA: BA14K family protein [Bradyrhizobium sp.]|nr:BA14K family protein [Bradyrhizobium sp.]